MCLCHAHFCTNDYPFLLNGFSWCTCLYEWLSNSLCMDCRHLCFCTNDYKFFLKWLSSFTFLYEWLPFLFEWIVVIYISVRMTINSFWMDCRRLHFCTNDYDFFFEWIVVIYISVWMTTISLWMGFRHVYFCTNDYPFLLNGLRHARFCASGYHFFLNWFSSYTFLCEWLPFLFEWIFVMHVSVRMTTVSLYMDFRNARFCAMTFNILCIRIFVMHISVRMTFHILLVFHVCNALQRVNSMVQWRIINENIMYIGFDYVLNAL